MIRTKSIFFFVAFLHVADAGCLFPTKKASSTSSKTSSVHSSLKVKHTPTQTFDLLEKASHRALATDDQCEDGYADACFVLDLLGGDDFEAYGSCGALFEETDMFCVDPEHGKLCCSNKVTDCCDPKGGAIAGVVIALAVALTAAICGCCACCKCCCLYDTFRPEAKNETQGQVSQTTSMPVASAMEIKAMSVEPAPPAAQASAY